MATFGNNTVKNAVPNVVKNIPVEIWQEIFHHVLFDPILFSTNPFYPGCNPHTALGEWHDVKRLRRHEVQRGALCLVCRSWKTHADRSSWQSLEAPRASSAAHLLPRLPRVHRLKLQPVCEICDALWNSRDRRCITCCTSEDGLYPTRELLGFEGPIKAKILIFPRASSNTQQNFLYKLQTNHSKSMPNLRALFMSLNDPVGHDIASIFSNLTVLGLRVHYPSTGHEDDAPIALEIPSVTVLQLRVGEFSHCDFLTKWHIPRLAHLDAAFDEFSVWDNYIYPFIEKNGMGLITARLNCFWQYFTLEEKFWKFFPRLEYLGISEFQLGMCPPPPDHPLRTFAPYEDHDGVHLEFRNTLCSEVLDWENLVTIADSHYWTDIPPDFSYPQDPNPDFLYHSHGSTRCYAACLTLLYNGCEERGLRYEDRTGRTLVEFQATLQLSTGDQTP